MLSSIRQKYTYQADVRYTGQAINISINIDLISLKEQGAQYLVQTFESAHDKLYGFCVPAGLEFVNIRIIVEESKKIPPATLLEEAQTPQPANSAKSGSTTIIYQSKEFKECPMWNRNQLLAGHVLYGPCLITEIDSTTVVLPNFAAEIDKYGNILIGRAVNGSDSVGYIHVERLTEPKVADDMLDPITSEEIISRCIGDY